MPSAASRKCSECWSASSKYNCRNCHPITSTCSLACSKKHQAENHIQSKDKGKETSNAASTSTSFSSTSSLNPTSNSTSNYVPINSYDSDQFQKDFNYLNQVGRYVSDLGRDLLNKRMIPQEMLNNNPNSNSNSNGQSNNIVGAAQHKRETLRKQLHFRGLNVLLLPEGMEMRKKNGTNWLHKESKMVYTVELRFPLTSTISIDASGSNSTSTLNPSSTAASSSSQASFCNKVVLLNRQNGDSILQRLVLEELERRTLESNKNSGETVNKSEVESTEVPQNQESIEPNSNSSGNGQGSSLISEVSNSQPQHVTKGGKLSSRAKKRLKREAVNNASSDTKSENPITNSNSNPNQGQNQKKNNRKGKTNNSRISDTNFKPDFKISSTIWKEVGIQEGKCLTTESEEVYQQLPEASVLLLPIFESRLRNETSLKHLDWFERQKSKVGNGSGRENGDEEFSTSGREYDRNLRNDYANGNGDGRSKGKGKEQNSNNIPLGQRNTPQSSNSNVSSNQHSTLQPSTGPFNKNSSTVPHYTGPPPSFNPTSSSIPHYNGPPPPFHSSLPAHPGFANGRANGSNNSYIAPSQVRNVSMQPPVAQFNNQETSQANASSSNKNPLVSSSLLSKLSSMIPNASKANPHTSMEPVSTKQDLNELTQFNQEGLNHLSKSASASTLFESLSHSNVNNSEAQVESTSRSNSDESNQVSEKPTVEKAKTRPRTLLSLKPTDSLEQVLKTLPQGYAVVEYATVELWSKERFEEMKSKGEIEVKELELSANQVENDTFERSKGEERNGKKRSNEELEQNESSSQVKVEKKSRLESSSAQNGDLKGKSEPSKEASIPVKKSLSNLVAYESDSEDEDEEEEDQTQGLNKVAASELLTNLENVDEDSEMKDNDEEEEEEEVNYGSGIAGLARAFGIAPVIDHSKIVEKETASSKVVQSEKVEVGNGKVEEDVEMVNSTEVALGQGDEEELDWGEDE